MPHFYPASADKSDPNKFSELRVSLHQDEIIVTTQEDEESKELVHSNC